MLWVAAVGVAVIAVPLTGGRLARLAEIRLRGMPFAAAALVAAVAVTTLYPTGSSELHRAVNLGTYLVALAVLFGNRNVTGLRIVVAGAASNVLAIVANGGVMPATAHALARAGMAPGSNGFLSSTVLNHPRLLILGDVFAIPHRIPFANVFSIGDALIVAGGAFAVLRICGSHVIPASLRRGPSAV